VFHAGYLSPYKEMEEHSPNFPEPPPELVEGEPEYEIEHIVDMRRFGYNKKLQYKVHWKGYAKAHDSWEPLENIHAPELLEEYHRENWTIICHIHTNTHPPNDKRALTLTPIFTSTPSKSFPSSLTMTNVEQDYEEQHISKEQQYRVLTRDMPHCLAYLSHRDQQAIRLDQLGNNPTPTEVDTFIHCMGLNPSSMSICQQIRARLDDNAPPFEFIVDHPTPYHSPSPDPIPIPPCLDEISPTHSEIGSKLWEQTHFPEGLTFLRTQSPSSPALDHPLSAAMSLSYLPESDNNPLAEFPHTSVFNTPYVTPEPFEHTDWGEEIVVEDIGEPAKDLRQFGAHPGAHWVVYNPHIHSNYILIPAGPEGDAIFTPAQYITFQTNMHTGEPEILGTNGAGHRVSVEPLEAAPSQGPTLADDTDLKHLKEWYFADGDRHRTLQELGDNGILEEVVQLQQSADRHRTLMCEYNELVQQEGIIRQRRELWHNNLRCLTDRTNGAHI